MHCIYPAAQQNISLVSWYVRPKNVGELLQSTSNQLQWQKKNGLPKVSNRRLILFIGFSPPLKGETVDHQLIKICSHKDIEKLNNTKV